jgi:hypothetical protein
MELHIIRAGEFIRIDAREHLDLTASKDALRALAYSCRKRGLDCAMLDLRPLPVLARPRFTKTELAALVGTFREAGFTRQQRLAILYRQDIHGGIRNFVFFSRMRGLQVQAFQEFESALQWLSQANTRQTGRREDEIPIPIYKRQSEIKKLPVGITAESRIRIAAQPAGRATNKQQCKSNLRTSSLPRS